MFRFRLTSRSVRAAVGLIAVVSLCGSPTVFGADQPAEHDHTHATAAASPKADKSGMSQMMGQMQAMHAKMVAAKTSAERAALMKDHMTMMQNGMTMMQGMKGMSSSKRMDMMQIMMEMMMDRMSMSGDGPTKPDVPK